jgi:hypothetical protein
MARFIERHDVLKMDLLIGNTTEIQRNEVQDIKEILQGFADLYASSMGEIHLAVKRPFSANSKQIDNTELRFHEATPFARLGYNEHLKAQTDMVTICDENCNRAQTSYTHFFHDAIPPLVMKYITEQIEKQFDDYADGSTIPYVLRNRRTTLASIINKNLNFVLVHALQYSALCRHLVKATDARTKTFDREVGFLMQLANNRNIHLCFVLYELGMNLMYDKKLIEENSSIFQRWWKWVVQEYCHLMGEQLSDIVFRDASMQFREGLFPKPYDENDTLYDAERVLAYVEEFLKHIIIFVKTNEFQVLLYKLLTIADLNHISRHELKIGCKQFFEEIKEPKELNKIKWLYAYLISNEAIWKRIKQDSTTVSAVNYDNMEMYMSRSQQNTRFFRLFATTMQLCAPTEMFTESKTICQKYISRDAVNSTFNIDDTKLYGRL